MVSIDREKCKNCGACIDVCPSLVIDRRGKGSGMVVHARFPEFCIACGHCVAVCPHGAVSIEGMPADAFRKVPDLPVDPEALKALMLSRRSIRKYRDQAVPEKIVWDLIEVATHAGTASNLQGVRFILLTDRTLLDRIEETVIDILWNSGLKYFDGGKNLRSRLIARHFGPDVRARMERTHRIIKTRRTEDRLQGMIFRGAPLVVLAHDEPNGLMEPINCALALRNMELLAHANGLGSCWVGFLINAADRKPAVINDLVGLDRSRRIYGALMLGYPKNSYLRLIPRSDREVKKR